MNKNYENLINNLKNRIIEEKQKELKETNDELFKTVSNNEKQFFNGRENTREFMIKYLKEKHGITEIDNKKISSYTSLYDKKYLKNYIEENYGIREIYKFYSKHESKHIAEEKEQKKEEHPVKMRLDELIDLGFTDDKKSRALNSGDEKQIEKFNHFIKAMSKGFPNENFKYDNERYNRYLDRINESEKNKGLSKDQIDYLELFNECLYIYTNDSLLPQSRKSPLQRKRT